VVVVVVVVVVLWRVRAIKYQKQTMFLVYKILQYSVIFSIVDIFILYYHFPKYVLNDQYGCCL
jgi:hypothetical protein